MNNRNTNRPLSASLLAAFVVNLILPASLGAAQLFCKDVRFIHSEAIHAYTDCCNNGDLDHQRTHSSCSWGQVCDPILENAMDDTPVIHSPSPNIAATPASISTLFSSPSPSKDNIFTSDDRNFTLVKNRYILYGAFLN